MKDSASAADAEAVDAAAVADGAAAGVAAVGDGPAAHVPAVAAALGQVPAHHLLREAQAREQGLARDRAREVVGPAAVPWAAAGPAMRDREVLG
jgi:hypothetical protein